MYTEFENYAERLPDDLLAAVSGGADSVALLVLLAEYRSRNGIRLQAVHVNHGLRGKESDGDEAFVAELCDRLQVPLYRRTLTPPDHPGEQWARDARYQAIREVARECGCNHVCLAHHRDDQAETLLLHLLRGSGLDGLTAMRSVSERDGMTLYRPLLHFSRQQLRMFLTAEGIGWREDSSNQSTDYLRNRIRNELLPLMDDLSKDVSRRIAQTAFDIQPDAEYLQCTAQQLIDIRHRELRISELSRLHEAMLRRVLRSWYHLHTRETLTSEQTFHLVHLVHGDEKTVNLQGSLRVVAGYTHIHLLSQSGEDTYTDEAEFTGTGDYAVGGCTVHITQGGQDHGNGMDCQEIPIAQLSGCILRTRRSGDYIRPFGSEGRKKLSDYLIDRKIDQLFRNRLPMLCRGHEVLWIAGVGAGAIDPWNKEEVHYRLSANDMPWQIKEKET